MNLFSPLGNCEIYGIEENQNAYPCSKMKDTQIAQCYQCPHWHRKWKVIYGVKESEKLNWYALNKLRNKSKKEKDDAKQKGNL